MRFDFPNDNNDILSGRLEMPVGRPRAYGLFAHCFTCSKDFIAARFIAKELASAGIGVLRFDFTGLGNSEGDFANTNFSSNVADLVAACSHLAKEFEPPELLIGHSLGGAAVLKAATQLEKVKAVATIAAPSSASHVMRVLDDKKETIEKQGEARITLAGRSFTIRKQLLDDLAGSEFLDQIEHFRKALLVLHAPLDTVVSVDHAARIFQAAKHPKSFVTLDNADHLLSRQSDARYAARVIAVWADRYLSGVAADDDVEEKTVRVRSRKGEKFTQDIATADHRIIADEPKSAGGENLGMNPYELLLAGLGACTSMTLKMYAERKEIDLEGVEVLLSHEKVHARDCADCDTKSGKIDRIFKKISLTGELSEKERQRLYEIAEKCPVNRTLLSEILIESEHM